MLHDKIIAAIRTGCAVLGASIVTYLVSLLGGWGLEVEIDPELSSILAVLLFGVLVALYNFIVAWATENVWDGFGWLLGVNKPPVYVDADLRHGATHSVAVPASSGTAEAHGYESDSPELDLNLPPSVTDRYPGDNYGDPDRA